MSLLEQYEQILAQGTSQTPHSLLDEVESGIATGLNLTEYENYLAGNRIHQTEALSILQQNIKGQIIIPTGTGKTRIQIAFMVGDMIAKTQSGTQGVYVIASHRLLLNKQLMDEFQDLCIRGGLPINALYVGSDRHDDKAVYDRYFSQGINSGTYRSAFTTSGQKIKTFQEATQSEGRNLIVVSTYHSFDKLISLGHIDLCCYDEAHNTTNEEFLANIKPVLPNINRNFYFTATRKVCATSGHGMENQDVYGNVLCEVSPRTMIDRGEMAGPRITAMMLDNDIPTGVVSDKNQHMLVKTIREAFIKNKELVKGHSNNPDLIGAKLLVSFVGSDELALVQDSEEFKSWCQTNNIRVFSMSSRHGSYTDFEEEVNRNRVYEELKGLQDQEDCILLHIDILTEGIDLPSLTGVLLLRHLNEVKLFQTFGRALRLAKSDRVKLYTGVMAPQDKDQFLKPYAYLILPMHFTGMETSSEDMRRTIQDVISTYGIPVEEFLPPEGFKARDTEALDPVTNHRRIARTQRDYPLLSVVQDFMYENFMSGLPTDSQDLYDALMNMLEGLEGLEGDSDA